MINLPEATEVTRVAGLLAPGLIILGIRSRFKKGPPKELKDSAIAYTVASAAYYAAAYPLFHANNGLEIYPWLWQLLQYFLFPAFIGLVIVFADQSDWFYSWARKFKLRFSHHIPAAWDYAFSNLVQGTFVLVKLRDGTQYAGVMGRGSFASSASEERDLFIEEVWSVPNHGPWQVVEPRRSVLLCGSDIKWVEIFRGISRHG